MGARKENKRVSLTFKESEEWLYDEIVKHSSYGPWIKDILIEHIKGEKQTITKPIANDDFGILGDL